MYFYIYKVTNKINSKSYVGKHASNHEFDDYLGSGILINKAIKKYGKENFCKIVLEYCTPENINDREKIWIEKENCLNPNGYNIAKGGEGGDLISRHPDNDQIRKDISRRVQSFYDNESDEHREWRSKRNKGKTRTDDTRHNISTGRRGIKFTDEHKKHISDACIEYMKNVPRYNQRAVKCYDDEGNFIEELDSIQKAAKKYEVNAREICNMCKKKRNKIKKFNFRYAEDPEAVDKIENLKFEDKRGNTASFMYTCPYCNRVGKGPRFLSYHFEKCKNKSQNEQKIQKFDKQERS